MKIFIASDHAGFELKEKLIPFVQNMGHEVIDMGPKRFNPGDDYPDYVKPVAEEVSKDAESKGIVLGGSGQGEAMATDKFAGIRAAVWYGGNLEPVKLSREHNDANILSLGARFITEMEAKEAVKLWLDTPFSGDERHVRRIGKIDQ